MTIIEFSYLMISENPFSVLNLGFFNLNIDYYQDIRFEDV